jgi:hypothetical protein
MSLVCRHGVSMLSCGEPHPRCECGDPWCASDHRDDSDAQREVFAGEEES